MPHEQVTMTTRRAESNAPSPEVVQPKRKTLLERIGGESMVKILFTTSFDELYESPEIAPFFRDAPCEAMITNHVKLFRCLLGPQEFHPKIEDLVEYIIVAHARLFRESGLNVSHFDFLAAAFHRALQSLLTDETLVEEVVNVIKPLRGIFEACEKMASDEKLMSAEERKTAMVWKGQPIDDGIQVILPDLPRGDVPSWFAIELKRISKTKSARDWSSCLADCCSASGDKVLADYFMAIPYLDLEPYMKSVIKLALLPDTIDDHETIKSDIFKTLHFPRGPTKEMLSRSLFERLTIQFKKVCHAMDVQSDEMNVLVKKLSMYSKDFPDVDPPMLHGLTCPHLLDRSNDVKQVRIDTSMISIDHSTNLRNIKHGRSKGKRGWFSDRRKSSKSAGDGTVSTGILTGDASDMDKSGQGIRKLFGWHGFKST